MLNKVSQYVNCLYNSGKMINIIIVKIRYNMVFKYKKEFYVLFLFGFIFLSFAFGVRANPAAFLDKGVGARPMGMGGAYTAVADDSASGYWNPAGLGKVDSIESSAMLQKLGGKMWPGLEEIGPDYQYFSIAVPLRMTTLIDKGAVSFSYISMEIDNIPHTCDEGVIKNTFSSIDRAFILSAGYPVLNDNISMGGSLRYISRDLGFSGAEASGWDAQIGKILSLTEGLNMGFTVERGPDMRWESGRRESGEVMAKLGFGYKYVFTEELSLISATDFIQRKEMPLKASAGGEFSYRPDFPNIPALFVRAGLNRLAIENRHGYMSKINETLRWCLGFGMEFDYFDFKMRVDYAFVKASMGSDHLLSLAALF